MRNVFLAQIEVRPLTYSKLYKNDPKARGAFVDCIASAFDISSAKEKMIDALSELGYEIISIRYCDSFDKFVCNNKRNQRKYKKMADAALSKGEIGFGVFHCYYEDN